MSSATMNGTATGGHASERASERTGEARISAVATVNGVALHAAGEVLPPDELRRRACTESA